MRRYDRSTAFIEFVIVAACGVYRRRTHVARPRPPDANKHNWVGVAYFFPEGPELLPLYEKLAKRQL